VDLRFLPDACATQGTDTSRTDEIVRKPGEFPTFTGAPGTLASQIDTTQALPAGDYCIGVRALSDPDLPITVTVSGFDEGAAMTDMYDMAEAAPPLDGSHPIVDLGVIQSRALVLDYARSTIPKTLLGVLGILAVQPDFLQTFAELCQLVEYPAQRKEKCERN